MIKYSELICNSETTGTMTKIYNCDILIYVQEECKNIFLIILTKQHNQTLVNLLKKGKMRIDNQGQYIQ